MSKAKLINHKSAKSTHPWIEEASFESMPQHEVLQGILRDVKTAVSNRVKHGGKPVTVVFDLDSTIFDVKPRTLRILKEFAQTKEGEALSPTIAKWCLNLTAHSLLYTLEESARANNVPESEETVRAFMKAAFQYWRHRFFTHQYVMVDHPTPGAVDFANHVVDAGAKAVYLTGRDWPGMGRGTRTMLEHWGFPTCDRQSKLIMKPNAGLDDSEFKDEALRELRIEDDVIALFDNEPANFHVFEKNFPEAWLVFYYSNCSTKEARSVKRIYRIDNFLF